MSIARARYRTYESAPAVTADDLADGIRLHATYVLWFTIGITVLGLLIGYSASATKLISEGLSPTREINREIIYTIIAFAFLAIASFSRFVPNAKGVWLYIGVKAMFWLSVVMVSLLYFASKNVKGSVRTLDFGWFHFQPTELAKFTVVAYILYFLLVEPNMDGLSLKLNFLFFRIKFRLKWFWDITNKSVRGFIALAVVFLVLLLILMQPDVGSTAFVGTLSMVALAMGGVKKRILFTIAGVALSILLFIIVFEPPRFKHVNERIDAWFNPLGVTQVVDSNENDIAGAKPNPEPTSADDESFQILQSLGAIANGGLAGQGYFRGVQKINRLPEQTNDFIFAVACEELGFLGALFIVALFIALLYNIAQVAVRIRNPFFSALVFLIGYAIFLQACINMATAANAAPTTGINLPLISFGGTSKIVTLTQIGIILAIARTFSSFERTHV